MTTKVILNSSSSKWINVTSAVSQGSVLGPLLFILYVNDITDGVQSTLEMFADDSKLYRTIHNQHMTLNSTAGFEFYLKLVQTLAVKF